MSNYTDNKTNHDVDRVLWVYGHCFSSKYGDRCETDVFKRIKLRRQNMIQYLVKFVGKEEYADSLLYGELYMHSVDYYFDLEYKNGPGQGDFRTTSNHAPWLADCFRIL